MEPAVYIILYLAGVAVCFAVAFLLNESVEHEIYCMETEEKIRQKTIFLIFLALTSNFLPLFLLLIFSCLIYPWM